jgi:hypothetical protein
VYLAETATTLTSNLRQDAYCGFTIAHHGAQSILRMLADDQDDDVRFTVAMKRKAEPEILDTLSQDPCESVREHVAYNRKTPLWILERLADDPIGRIAEAARREIEERTIGRSREPRGQPVNRRNTTVALWPPNPKLLLIAARTFFSRASLGA